MKAIVNNEKELEIVAREILKKSEGSKNSTAQVVALYGDLGSGKTTFTKEFAQILNIKEIITSPTFVILKTFEIKNNPRFKKLIHIDTYRLDLGDELAKLGFETLLNEPENLIVIEWPEIVENLFPENTIRVKFKFLDDTTRELEVLE